MDSVATVGFVIGSIESRDKKKYRQYRQNVTRRYSQRTEKSEAVNDVRCWVIEGA